MITKRIYRERPYSSTLTTSVLSINYDGENAKMITGETIFFPTGGGQSCDRGSISFGGNKAEVLDVYEENGEIVHVISKADAQALIKSASEIGEKSDEIQVRMLIDWNHRFENMQRHCGEHILSGAIYRLFGGINKGFHMGEDCISIDISFDDETAGQKATDAWGARLHEKNKYRKITWEMAEMAEMAANSVIWRDAPICVDHFESKEEAEKLNLRKKLTLETDISIVTIGDPSSPDDCVACCGTHPSSAGQVGLIKIYKIEPNKGMSRIHFEAGKRAFMQYRSRLNTLYDISLKLSTGYDSVNEKYDAAMNHMDELRSQLNHFRSLAIDSEAEDAIGGMHDGMVRRYENFSVDDLLNLGKKIAPSVKGIIALVDSNSNTVLLLSNHDCGAACAGSCTGAGPRIASDPRTASDAENSAGRLSPGTDCGKIIKTIGASFGGKGGGKRNAGRVFFADKNRMEEFLSAVFG